MSHTDFSAQSDLDSTAKFDQADLVHGWEEYERRVPEVVPLLKFSARTDMGQVRENNEDKFDFYEPEDPTLLAARGCFYAVADGIGGAQAGQIASEMMLKHVIATYYSTPAGDIQGAMQAAIVAANERIYQLARMIPERQGMGTTLIGALFVEDRVVIAQVGDSRAYLLRAGQMRQVSQDHSWVEEQVRAGLMSREDAEHSPFRNVITRSIGAMASVVPDFYEEKALPGDCWVLCSDGLSGYVDGAEMAQIVSSQSPSEATRQLVELANARGGRDNITVFVLSVRDVISYNADAAPCAPSPMAQAIACPTVLPSHVESSESAAATPIALSAVMGDATTNTQPVESETAPRAGWRKLFGR